MATLDVYYNAGSSFGWTDPSRAWNTLIDTYTTRILLPPYFDPNPEDYYLLSQTIGTSDPGGSYAITKVEIGLSHKSNEVFGDGYFSIRPVFGGSTNGTVKFISTGGGQHTDYADITSDAAGPGASNWTWSHISGLDLKTWGVYEGIAQAAYDVYEVWLRMTYTLLGFSKKFNGTSTYSKINGIAKTSLTKVNSIT